MLGNYAAWDLSGITEAATSIGPGVDWVRGHFYKNGLVSVLPKFSLIIAPERFARGIFNFLTMLHHAGVTTALDMGIGGYGKPTEELLLFEPPHSATQYPRDSF